MEKETKDYLHSFELKLTDRLVAIAHDKRFGSEHLYQSEDIEAVWEQITPAYMSDAVPNVAQYPTVAVAWAGYIGMALARWWDKDWTMVTSSNDVYAKLASPRGFDEMDEYIVEQVLGYRLDTDTAQSIEDLMRSMSQAAVDAIRYEQVEPQSELAFHVFARAVRSIFRVGASCQLYRMGYKWVKQ